MFDFFIVPVVAIVFAGLAGAGYLVYLRRRQRKAIDDILFDVNPLAEWAYTPEEWCKAIEEELSWGSVNDGATQIRISRTGIYFKNSRREHLIPLNNGTRVVTFAGYLGGQAPLKLRTRWRVVNTDQYGREEIKYHKEDFRIPVPPREKDAAEKVVSYFTKWIEDNMNLYTKMVPDDEPISLFGKDSF